MTNARLHILVVDDDERIRTMLQRYLTGEGFDVSLAGEGGAMRAALAKRPADLVLLDLVMPGEDGLTLIRAIRQDYRQVPIILLTGKVDVIDRVVGLEAGADDYIAKPFHLREVLARIRTVLRRAAPAAEGAHAPDAAPVAAAGVLSFLDWRLDEQKRELRRAGGEAVALTSSEYDLLHALAGSPNRVLNRDQIMDLAKGRDWAANDRAVDTQIVRLRRKIERDPKNPELIKTVRGAGYVFAASVTRSRPG
ncbi:MAG: response regulator [Alphaproteobacteria bacterium]|nr:response regulator [Alphaproteobacteria bacterium]